MIEISLVTQLDECQRLWEATFPRQDLTDLWEVRACFQQHFQRPPCFIVAHDLRGVCGLLPLSWIEEAGQYGYFPGETWQGHTWLEQNRIFARNGAVLAAMLAAVPGPYHLRYLLPAGPAPAQGWVVDEIGYHFLPPAYGYEMETYYQAFAHRTTKRLRREIAEFEQRGLHWRFDVLSDYRDLVQLNVERFGERSYFSDPRFRDSFRSLVELAEVRGWLRMTTARIEGQTAAVDFGCVHGDTYTLLAGGTHADFPGVAKLINLHHMAYACRERFRIVDFLCGNFSWKEMFHLSRRPLYLLADPAREPKAAPRETPENPAYVG